MSLVPTTILAAIDAAIGGKNALDLDQHKNVVGTIHWPRLTLCCTELLDLRNLDGFSEAVKIAALYDEELFDFMASNASRIVDRDVPLLTEVLWRSAAAKAEAVESLELANTGLLYGHNIGHAVESALKGTMGHAAAVTIGIDIEAALGVAAGVLSQQAWNRQRRLLEALGLDPIWPQSLDPSLVTELLLNYKMHTSKHFLFVLPSTIGQRYVEANSDMLALPRDDFETALSEAISWASRATI